MRNLFFLLGAGALIAKAIAGEIVFQDHFTTKLQPGWFWVRENPGKWRSSKRGLEVWIEPGNMWGPANDARNVLVRNAPDPAQGPVEVSVILSNHPTNQYEQVDLVWYYNESYMVKIGQEMVDGKMSIVMGREENDRTRTIAIIPIELFTVELRLSVNGNRIHGQFRAPGGNSWQEAGECDLPIHGEPKISLQCYQGTAAVEHWALLKDFTVRRTDK